MERAILGITRRDRKRHKCIRERIKVTDVIRRLTHLKWDHAGHVAKTKVKDRTHGGTGKKKIEVDRWQDGTTT